MATLTFKKLTVNSFGGINKNSPIVLDLQKFYSTGKRIAKVSGDQGTGKSSLLHAIMYAAAMDFDFKLVNLVNLEDGTISEEFEFEKDGKNFKVKATKSKFELLRLFRDGDDERWIAESDPKTNVKKLIGQVATSPMFLKQMDAKKQIDWLYSMLEVPQEIKDKEASYKESLKTATSSRTEANKSYEGLKKLLSENELYQKWEESEKLYAEEKSSESEKKKVDELEGKKTQFTAAIQKVETLKRTVAEKENSIDEIEAEIERLQQKLKDTKSELSETKKSLKTGEKWIEDNKSVNEEYEAARESYMNIERYLVAKSQWEAVKKKKAEMDEFETLVQNFDAQKDQLRQNLRDLSSEALPRIEGLQVITDDSIDGMEMGIYLNGKTPAQLCESELFDFYFQLVLLKKIPILVIENLNSLGSNVVETLNKLAEQGAYIWYSEMNRHQNKLKIEFSEKIV